MLVGLLIGIVGTDVNSGVLRFNFGIAELSDGVSIIARGDPMVFLERPISAGFILASALLLLLLSLPALRKKREEVFSEESPEEPRDTSRRTSAQQPT